ncbi:hypothetical protein [Acinetobacter junii]|uniref:hypothetical protein n=1 Tax=Acinetobacter junii TaxID=40215 RepID=UPI0002CF9DE5|nr:hypothetical protein [Acinetobacter junii]ENV52024.1 hypothetical protein F953_00514 [Acinetobacter junii CIP 107470 = MTCC 11364]ENV52057.1 hypothetical protein F953_00547 [Acinetobacter junii CIP 107470 = MTCC 11364]ENV52433.1 hypothetical protein F953_00128 [Acinetobacter junii CIP 107470 = MTCC 11364]
MKPFSSTLGHTIVLGNNGKTSSCKTTTFEAIKADMLKNKGSYRDIKIDDVAEIKNK